MRLPDLGAWLRSVGRETASLLANSTLPETCAGCGVTGAWFCADCASSLARDGPPGCQRCGRSGIRRPDCRHCRSRFPLRLTRLRAGYAYDGAIRRAVQRFKYSREFARGRDLGRLLASRYPELMRDRSVDAIVPVPLHQRRYRERGFNQSQVLAEELRDVAGAPVVSAVRRIRHTPPQVQLRSHQRMSNLTDAFDVMEGYQHAIEGKRLLIVDDVTTTGATIASVALLLQRGGAKEILALALAREQ